MLATCCLHLSHLARPRFRQGRPRRVAAHVLRSPREDSLGILGAVEYVARESLRKLGLSDAQAQSAVIDLHARLLGWPEQPCDVSEEQSEEDTGAVSRVGVRKRYFLDDGVTLEVELSPSLSAHDVDSGATLQLQATLHAPQPPERALLLWDLTPSVASSDASGTLVLLRDDKTSLLRASTRVQLRASVHGIAIRLRIGAQPVMMPLLLPTPAGLLIQLAADAALSGSCAVQRQLSLGRGENTGTLLAIVRNQTNGDVSVELFSDTQHRLVLHWALLERRQAPGGPTWSLPPPELRQNDCHGDAGSAPQLLFQRFSAEVDDGNVSQPAIASLQRCCLSFNAAAAERWGGLAFVLRSACGQYAWHSDFANFILPWEEEQCAVSWEEAPYLLEPAGGSSWSPKRMQEY